MAAFMISYGDYMLCISSINGAVYCGTFLWLRPYSSDYRELIILVGLGIGLYEWALSGCFLVIIMNMVTVCITRRYIGNNINE